MHEVLGNTRSCIKKPHRGIEPEVPFFNLIGLISLRSTLPVIVTALVWVLALVWVFLALGDTNTAFGIFSLLSERPH